MKIETLPVKLREFNGLIILLSLILFTTPSFSQNVDTVELNGEQYFVYPFNVPVDIHSDYYDCINDKLNRKKEKKSLKKPKTEENNVEELRLHSYQYSMRSYYSGSKKEEKGYKKYVKAVRNNPYPLLQQGYELNYDIIPSLDPIPDGKYVQLFEDFCMMDEKGACLMQRDRVAAYFTLKNNTLEGDACWLDVKGDTLKSGSFNGGLKDGVWRLEVRDLGYRVSGKSRDNYIKKGIPFVDTTIEYQEYKNGAVSGSYKRYMMSDFPITEGTFLENSEVGEWITREITWDGPNEEGQMTRNRNNANITSRYTIANISDSIIVKQPWIRDGLISYYEDAESDFNFNGRYDLYGMRQDLFLMAFPTIENLDLDEEQYGSYEEDLDFGGFGGDYGRVSGFSYYQPSIYDKDRDEFFTRGYVIDSIGMIAKYDGVMEGFYPNGQLRYRYVFEEGKLLKEDTIFWDNGQAHDVINFIADSNHYVRSIYDYDGKTFKEIVYDELGDFKTVQYYFDNREFIEIDGYKAISSDYNMNYFYDNQDTINFELNEPLDLYRSWFKGDQSIIRNKHYNPNTRTLVLEDYNALGVPSMRSEKTFTEEFESWTGKTYVKYDNLKLVNTQSATYRQDWFVDSFPQDNVLSAYQKFDVADEFVLFKNDEAYTGEVVFNFDKNNFSLSNKNLTINFAKPLKAGKETYRSSQKFIKKVEKYRKNGSGADDARLNYFNTSESKSDVSDEIYSAFFDEMLASQFSYPETYYNSEYSEINIKNSQLPKTAKIVGYMLDGKPHGTWRAYDQFKNIIVEVPFVNGEVDGELKYFHYEYPEEYHDNYSWGQSPFKDTFPDKRIYFMSASKEFKNGNAHGVMTVYDWMGGITLQEEFKEGYRDGTSIERNQLAFSKSHFQNGLLDGYVQTYLLLPERDSILLYDLNFQDGSLQGESKSYHINGNVSKKGFFLDGQPIEDYEAYDSLGFRYHYVKFKYSFPIEEKIWEENQLSVRYKFAWEDSIYFEPSDITTSQSLERMLISLGFGGDYLNQPYYGRPSLVEKVGIKYRMTKYYPNDTVARDGFLDGGKKIGLWKFYDYEGELLYMVNYQDTILSLNDSTRFKSKGIYLEVDAAGDTLYTAHIIEKFEKYDCSHTDHYEVRQLYTISEVNDSIGRKNGYVRNYYDNGVLQNEGEVKDGLPTGTWKFYDPFGKLNQYGSYTNGKRNGRWLSGDLSKTKYLGDICLNPNLPDLEDEIKYRENLLDIMITNYKFGKSLNKQFYDVDMNRFLDLEDEEAMEE